MMKYSGGHRLRRRNSCTALRTRPPRGEGDLMAATYRQPRVRRLSVREHSHTESPQAGAEGDRAGAPVPAAGGTPTAAPATPPLGSDPSLRVSTILKRWNSHRERRLSDSRTTHDSTLDTPPSSRKFSSCFGKRSGGGGRRTNECLILEPSEMIVIDYPDVQLMRPGQRVSCNAMNLEKLLALEQDEITIRPVGRGAPPPPPGHHHHQYDPEHHHHHHVPHHHHSHHDTYLPDLVGSAILRGARSRGSVGSSVRDGSDTSSAYSGSDTMCHSLQSSLEPDDVDLSGLTESAVDSDEEDLAESIESLAVRDAVRECLEKDPSERTEDDIKVLLEFTQRLRAFSNMTLAVRKAMCSAMVFAVVEEAGTVLMNHGEELDSWSVIINGHVEVTQLDGSVHELHLGDSLVKRQNVITKNSFSSASFGITPTMEKLYHQGIMRSKVDDCQFVCIRQTDYYRILHQSEENIRRIEENGVLVLITEQRPIDAGNRKGNIVIKGTAERLMQQLVEVENNVDPTYVEDFLLTHRTFIVTPLTVANKLLHWFEEPSLRDRVTRVVLLWVNNHFTDFEMDPVMMNFLEQFEEGLEREKMAGQLRLLDFACATKAQARTVTLTRPSRDEILQFSILGGYERGYGIFISMVEKGSKAEDVGLKRGDQILEVNGQSFDHMNHAKALEILRQTCHLSITVKSNLLAFKEMLMTPDNSPRPRSRRTSDARGLSDNNQLPLNATFASTMNIPYDPNQQSPRDKGKIGNNNKGSSMTTKANKFKKKVIESLMPRNNAFDQDSQANSDDSVSSHSSVGGGLYHSHSNPDLSTTGAFDDVRAEFPEHVLKVYRATDQSARFLPVHKETTAREVVMLALQIFNINDPTGSSNYALYEITVTEEGFTKQKRLQDSLQNLAERIGLSSRYYLKNITVSQTLFPDDIVNELVRESTVYFLQLNSVELAIQLTLEDYTVFRKIEPTEYIDYLFNLKSNYGTPALSQFAELVNREMFWVVSEVCSEHNLVKRSKTIKQFIKVARQCKECKNFNSMFAILSGLGHGAVSRLKQTWERLPSKYQRMYQEMQELMDPSRNMSKYRNLVQNENIQSPIIPFYPVVARDLTFTHEGNDDKIEGLINFEKLRMISRYIRDLQNMCSAPYDLFTIQDAGGQPPSSALISLNQMAGGGHQIATVKRRKKSTAAPDKKKMYEEAQMVRRVKAYLSRMNIITDEERLRNMSYECEAGSEGHKPTGGTVGHSNNNNSGSNSAPPTNPPPRRRPNSPTPSTTSSTSSTSQTSDGKKQTAKFGSMTSTECHVGLGESDSGISTHFDGHSSSSLEVGGVVGYECLYHHHSSPPAHHRRYSHQPESRSRPPFPHAVAVLPPVPAAVSTGMCMGSARIRRGAPGVPPDYVATQLRMKKMGRALSHDGVQYYSQTHHDDEEEDAQVSAV
ncbi:rap guanine nucleotide exchange factor 2-like isoform X6 [Homarus americanus]|uniref:rap guanine nucleotide exchange factor 2-like isoform X6 n=1 Tax=Homarus americanus TaxID=6706 RepID=UPI001C460284|nr:rap guanine nucleotide exchange factor 2-like isoform X6 [Homarus americanus]